MVAEALQEDRVIDSQTLAAFRLEDGGHATALEWQGWAGCIDATACLAWFACQRQFDLRFDAACVHAFDGANGRSV